MSKLFRSGKMFSPNSLSTTSPPDHFPSQPSKYPKSLEHAPRGATPSRGGCIAEQLQIQVEDGPDGSFVAFLHRPVTYSPSSSDRRIGVILLSGAGGGVTGPSGIYLSIADKLASLPDG